MDSSPDLSLKLRRGSSDSRDSFYMDFAQGIDSDIEEVDTTIIARPPPPIPPHPIIVVNDGEDDIETDEIEPAPSPPPPLPPLPPLPDLPPTPPEIPYDQTSQPNTPSPSSSPSPPPTPPPCPPLSTPRPPPDPLPIRPPLTPPTSPPHTLLNSPPLSLTMHSDPTPFPTGPSTPPDVISDVEHHVTMSAVKFQMVDDDTDESSTTITTPPSTGVASTSSVATPVAVASGASLASDRASLPLPHGPPPSLALDDSTTVSDLPTNAYPNNGYSNYNDQHYQIHNHHHHHHQQQQFTTSPMSSAHNLVYSENASHASSPAKSSSRLPPHHRVTIDESNLPLSSSSTQHQLVPVNPPDSPSPGLMSQLSTTNITAQPGHLALMYHHHQLTTYPVLPAIKRQPHRIYHHPPESRYARIKAGDALATLFSALYGKLLVVMGIAFPMAEVISTYIPPSFYEAFYLYLYIGSMLFLLFMYATLLWGRPKIPLGTVSPTKSKKRSSLSGSDSMDDSETNSTDSKPAPPPISARRPSLLAPLGRQHHFGSFYLRMGAVAFGIGSMIYSGLEFGQYFELERDTKCHNVMLALTPATRMAFIFIQMYFIFLNNEQIKVYQHKIVARFGLMHMIGTNLAVWLNVLIQETKHEILTFYNPENRTLRISHRLGHRTQSFDHSSHLRVTRGLKGPYQIFECRRTNIIGTLVQDASPFLFPCTIEYSLICAAILYVMWRSISRPQVDPPLRIETVNSPMKRSPHHYSVDCARAHKGLFVGILILVLTIISLILFFVLVSRPDFVHLAVTEVTICELFIYASATIATLIGMVQMRHLQYDAARSFELDDILLVGAQTGSFLYNIFTVIAGHFTLRRDTILVLINALASIVQTACQTMFILDAGRRQAVSPSHIRKKPGREIVTFMLVVNLAMWAISTLEKSRAESHPIQLNFYGLWAWTIITHVSMPLAIFYRFHSTVCLCEIWKRAYKLKPTYM